jgi:dTDP-4-amino-4,6-dideoxygalactose transaminase
MTNSDIPLVDLAREHAGLEPEVSRAISRVLRSGRYVLGDELREFESELAKSFGVPYAVGVNTGTSALHLALLVAGVTPGSEVITTPLTFAATGLAVKYVGATLRLVDVDPETWNMDPDQVENSITERTRAIIAVHLHGRPCDMDRLRAICTTHHLVLIEDAAHAHGALYKNQYAGSLGDMAAFSFYPTKVLGSVGQGGALLTYSSSAAAKARQLRSYGSEDGIDIQLPGFNYRLDEIQSALLRIKLCYIESYVSARRKIAELYTSELSECGFQTPSPEGIARHSYYVYSLRVKRRDDLRQFLSSRGIQSSIHYQIPLHLLSVFERDGFYRGQFPNAERCADEFLSLPLYPALSTAAIERVISTMREWMEEAGH